MHRRSRKPRGLKVRRYVTRLIDIKKYLAMLTGEKISDKMFLTDINEILLNSICNSWSKQAYVQVFDYEFITLTSTLRVINS